MISDLLLLVAPAGPEKTSGFCAGKPAITRQSFWRQKNFDNAAVKAFGGVVIDGRAQVFEVTAGATVVAPMALISAAGFARDFGQRFAAPPAIEALDAAVELLFVSLTLSSIGKVDR